MKDAKTEKLHNILKEDDLNGISFYDSKLKLMKLGYSEDEISIAVAHNPFDEKQNTPKIPVENIYETDTQTANKIGRELLAFEAEKRQRRINSDGAKLAFGGIYGVNPISARAFMSLSDTLGVPIFRIVVLGIFIAAVSFGLYRLNLYDISMVFNIIKVYLICVALFIDSIAVKDKIWYVKTGAPRHKGRHNIKILASFLIIAVVTILYLI